MILYHLFLAGHDVAELTAENPDAVAHAEHDGTPHLLNIVAIIANYFRNIAHDEKLADLIANNVNVIYSIAIMLLVWLFFVTTARSMIQIPGRRQAFVELIFTTLDGFVTDVLGSSGRTYVPLVGSLFVYILVMNLCGIIPLLGHSPSSSLNITLSLALIVFFTVQIHGIRGLGFAGWIKHYAGISDKPHPIEYVLAPLMLVLHIVGELAKPVSLSLRLFGNITGEDVLLAVFVMLLASVFIPAHLFVYPIIILSSFIQALVFALLTTVYILLMSPHTEEH